MWEQSGGRGTPVVLMPGDEFRLDRSTGEFTLFRQRAGMEIDMAERFSLGQVKGYWELYAQQIGEVDFLMMCKMAAVIHGLTVFSFNEVADNVLSCFVEALPDSGADGA